MRHHPSPYRSDTLFPYTTRFRCTPVSLRIENVDQRSKDYGEIRDKFRPGHADYTYWAKYGIRDYRGGGRSSARETASRVAAGAVARQVLKTLLGPRVSLRGPLGQNGHKDTDCSQRNRDGRREEAVDGKAGVSKW